MGSDGSATGGGRSDRSEWQRSAGNEPALTGEVAAGYRNRIDWQAIKTEYITTDTSYRKLAEKYGVSRVQVGNVGKEENWVELRRQHLDRTVTKTVAAVESAQVERAKRVQTVADKILNKIEALVDSERPLDSKSIRALTAALKDLKEVHGVKSDLDEQEQKARIANLQKNAEKEDDPTDVIEVVFAAGPEEWNE